MRIEDGERSEDGSCSCPMVARSVENASKYRSQESSVIRTINFMNPRTFLAESNTSHNEKLLFSTIVDVDFLSP